MIYFHIVLSELCFIIMAPTVKVNLLFFAKAKELTGQTSVELDFASELTLRDFIDKVILHYPSLRVLKDNLIIALNQNYVNNLNEILLLNEKDEIALIPPISGG